MIDRRKFIQTMSAATAGGAHWGNISLARPFKSMRQIFVSTATTGFSMADGDRIIEIGCVEMIDCALTDNSLHFYLNPGRDNYEDALQLHGIPDEFLRDKPRFSEVAPSILNYLSGADVIAHYANAHIGFLDKELERMGKPELSTWVTCITDTLAMAEAMFPDKCNSLDALCDRLGVKMPSLPSGLGSMVNAELTADVYVQLLLSKREPV